MRSTKPLLGDDLWNNICDKCGDKTDSYDKENGVFNSESKQL